MFDNRELTIFGFVKKKKKKKIFRSELDDILIAVSWPGVTIFLH